MDHNFFCSLVYKCLLDMATEEGINASGKEEIYGCIFGRDSAITILKILKSLSNTNFHPSLESEQLLTICRRTLYTLVTLQGKVINVESGEEPGKFVHEFRRDKYHHLTAAPNSWYLYPDNTLKNYDSIDSTPLILIALYKFWQQTKDMQFIQYVVPAVERGLGWMLTFADKDQDKLLEYELSKTRKSGGLLVQSWTDSRESLLKPDGTMPQYPIAPVEVQGYAWYALTLWAEFFATSPQFANKTFAETLSTTASRLKERFNDVFIIRDNGFYFAAQALDGRKEQIKTITANPFLLLWASHVHEGKVSSILDEKYVGDIIKRSFMPDLFDPDAGIRTMSSASQTYNPNQDSYHNGSFWPKVNGMAHEGLVKWGFKEEADQLKHATLKPLIHFGTPIELYIKHQDGSYLEYKNEYGQVSCRYQAWSAAAALDLLTS